MIYPTAVKNFYLDRSATADNGVGGWFIDRDSVTVQTIISAPIVMKSFSMTVEYDPRGAVAASGYRVDLYDGSTPILEVIQVTSFAMLNTQDYSIQIPGDGIRIETSLGLGISQRNTGFSNLKASSISVMYQGGI